MSKRKPENGLPVFSDRFRSLRGEQNQETFADFLGISRPTVGFYENGTRIPDAITLLHIAKKCKVTTDYLLGLTKNSTPETAYVEEALGLSTDAIISLKGNPEVSAAVNHLFSSAEQLKVVMPEYAAHVVEKGLTALSSKISFAAKNPKQFQFAKNEIDVVLLEILLGFRLED